MITQFTSRFQLQNDIFTCFFGGWRLVLLFSMVSPTVVVLWNTKAMSPRNSMALWVKVVRLGNLTCPNSKDQCLGVSSPKTKPTDRAAVGDFLFGGIGNGWLVWAFLKGRFGKSHFFCVGVFSFFSTKLQKSLVFFKNPTFLDVANGLFFFKQIVLPWFSCWENQNPDFGKNCW